jgi:hypothetical protein
VCFSNFVYITSFVNHDLLWKVLLFAIENHEMVPLTWICTGTRLLPIILWDSWYDIYISSIKRYFIILTKWKCGNAATSLWLFENDMFIGILKGESIPWKFFCQMQVVWEWRFTISFQQINRHTLENYGRKPFTSESEHIFRNVSMYISKFRLMIHSPF